MSFQKGKINRALDDMDASVSPFDGGLHIGELAAGGMHEIDVFNQGSPQCASHCLSTPVGYQTTSDLLLYLLTQHLQPGLHILLEKTSLELREILI